MKRYADYKIVGIPIIVYLFIICLNILIDKLYDFSIYDNFQQSTLWFDVYFELIPS